MIRVDGCGRSEMALTVVGDGVGFEYDGVMD